MEEKKCRRRSLRNLRRSSSIILPPSQVLPQAIESDGEHLLMIGSAYGSAWLGESTIQDIGQLQQLRASPEIVKSGCIPSSEGCLSDKLSVSSVVMNFAEQPQVTGSCPLAENAENQNISMHGYSSGFIEPKRETEAQNRLFSHLTGDSHNIHTSNTSLTKLKKNLDMDRTNHPKKAGSGNNSKLNQKNNVTSSKLCSVLTHKYPVKQSSFKLAPAEKNKSVSCLAAKSSEGLKIRIPVKAKSLLTSENKHQEWSEVKKSVSDFSLSKATSRESNTLKNKKRITLKKNLAVVDTTTKSTVGDPSQPPVKLQGNNLEHAMLDSFIYSPQPSSVDSAYDIEMTEDFVQSFGLPFFPPCQHLQKDGEKDESKDKRKSLRRSSRYFKACEMPLARASLEEISDSDLRMSTEDTKTRVSAEEASPRSSMEDVSLRTSSEMVSPRTSTDSTAEYFPERVAEERLKPPPLNGDTNVHSLNDCVSHEDWGTLTDLILSNCDATEDIFSFHKPEENKENINIRKNKLIKLNERDEEIVLLQATNKILIDKMMDDFKSLSVTEEQQHGESWRNEKNNEENLAGIVSGRMVCDHSESHQQMMEITPDKSASDEVVDQHTDGDALEEEVNVKRRSQRSRKSWDFSQSSRPKETKTAKKRNSEAVAPASSWSKRKMSESGGCPPQESDEISPALREFYLNKNYMPPRVRTWESIKESPVDEKNLFTKQKSKRFLLFEAGVTNSKLQKRHKKAVELRRKSGCQIAMFTDEEFRQKLLDLQLMLDE